MTDFKAAEKSLRTNARGLVAVAWTARRSTPSRTASGSRSTSPSPTACGPVARGVCESDAPVLVGYTQSDEASFVLDLAVDPWLRGDTQKLASIIAARFIRLSGVG